MRFLALSIAGLVLLGSGACRQKSATSPSPALFNLSGVVSDVDSATPPAGARVEILDGANAGRSGQTDAAGRYALTGLEAGTFTMRATASGFESVSRSIALASTQTADFALRRLGIGSGLKGRVVDAFTDRGLAGVVVRFDDSEAVTTDADGQFRFEAIGSARVRAVTLTSPGTVERQTHVRVPGVDTTLSLMPSSFNLAAFNDAFRSGGVLRRWVAAPRLVVQQRVLQFTNVNDEQFVSTAATMGDADARDLVTDLTWALPQLTGGLWSSFADVRFETAAEGATVPIVRPGVVFVARFQGLSAGSSFNGYTRWWWNGGGELLQAAMMLDNSFETSGSPFRRSLRSHELGHAMSYTHVTTLTSVMNSNGRVEPTPFDRDGARFVFQRPPLNRAPDIDPDLHSVNRVSGSAGIFSNGMP